MIFFLLIFANSNGAIDLGIAAFNQLAGAPEEV